MCVCACITGVVFFIQWVFFSIHEKICCFEFLLLSDETYSYAFKPSGEIPSLMR